MVFFHLNNRLRLFSMAFNNNSNDAMHFAQKSLSRKKENNFNQVIDPKRVILTQYQEYL